MFGYQEIYSGFDQGKFQQIRDLLQNAGIKYRDAMKSQSTTRSAQGRAVMGTMGENSSYSTMYKISVKKDQVEKAKYIIRNGN